MNTSFAEPKSMGKIRKHCNYRILIPIYLPNFEARFYLVAMCPLNSPVIQFTVQERKLWWHSSRISTCCLWTLEYKITVIIIGFAIIDCTIIICTGPAIHRPSSVQSRLRSLKHALIITAPTCPQNAKTQKQILWTSGMPGM